MSTIIQPNIEESWKNLMLPEFEKPYFTELKLFLLEEKKKYKVFPPGNQIFNAFNITPFAHVKVVLLGQDPYHGENQAHGLSFSVPMGVKKPPSLQNIFKELNKDVNFSIPEFGNLEKWARQGVLLLNATLTVRANSAGAHQGKGWELFTDKVISNLSENKENIVFLLWGNYAIAKEKLIDTSKHLVLKAAHPSPFSAHRGFFGCKHFSKTNDFLKEKNIQPIDWQL